MTNKQHHAASLQSIARNAAEPVAVFSSRVCFSGDIPCRGRDATAACLSLLRSYTAVPERLSGHPRVIDTGLPDCCFTGKPHHLEVICNPRESASHQPMRVDELCHWLSVESRSIVPLKRFEQSTCPHQAGADDAVQVMKPIRERPSDRKLDSIKVLEKLLAIGSVDREVPFATLLVQASSQRKKLLAICGHFASDLHQHQYALFPVTLCLSPRLVARDLDCQGAGTIGRSTESIGDDAQQSCSHHCGNATRCGPSLPHRNTIFTEQPTTAQRVNELHCVPPRFDDLDSGMAGGKAVANALRNVTPPRDLRTKLQAAP